ncbi:hypothetical protein K2173_021604 [Erythroxylum novogranatense]|uniref:NAC domain-containing protein n=1 Tax=Erythroxylum novogranatense TaxID=1862640 RepID=A0AAV8TPR5_9ROSI|nr:hypothetical protein K2173_021604 [Erythroxylum novogranatense]
MPEVMNLSINGQSQVPPGFRFHPTEEELLHYYLRKKVAYEQIDLDVIREVDLNKLEPWDIQEKCKIGSTPQNDWYFFSHKDKKYPTGTRTNRATAAGFWKATGRDKVIYSGFRRIGLRKTLVFYMGRAPHGQKSDWIMHEYRLDDTTHDTNSATNPTADTADAFLEEGWVVCRVFRKKNYQKSLDSPKGSSSFLDTKTHILSAGGDAVLDQILLYMGRTCKTENESMSNHFNNPNDTENVRFLPRNTGATIVEGLQEKFLHLPRLDSPTLEQEHSFNSCCHPNDDEMLIPEYEPSSTNQANNFDASSVNQDKKSKVNDWITLDRLVASQLNGHVETSKQLACFTDPNGSFGLFHDDDMQLSLLFSQRSNQTSENDLWNFTHSSSPSASDPLGHLSV